MAILEKIVEVILGKEIEKLLEGPPKTAINNSENEMVNVNNGNQIINFSEKMKFQNESQELFDSNFLSKKLREVFHLMNQGRRLDKFTTEGITRLLQMESYELAYDYFNGNKIPTIGFIDNFCNVFGVNKLFFEQDGVPPFKSDEFSMSPYQVLELVKNNDFENLYLVRSKGKEGKTGVVLMISKYYFRVLSKVYWTSSEGGGTSQRQTAELFEVIESLNGQFRPRPQGILINDEVFDSLFSGKMYPPNLTQISHAFSHWADYLWDIHHQDAREENYREWFGEAFLETQKIIEYSGKRKAS